jgi:putative DNA primase/helicase
MVSRLRSKDPGAQEIPREEVSLRKLMRTDSGNAERYVRMYGERLRYCHPWKRALTWDGKRWKLDERGRALGWTKDVARSIYREASQVRDEGERDESARWAKVSEKLERRKAMLTLANVEDGIPVLHSELDRHPLLINVANGTLDLETMKLREHDRNDLLTAIAPVAYDPNAECPSFAAFLTRILPDEGIRDFVQTAVGYSLAGNVGEQVLFFPHGEGANGKSTLLTAIQGVLGGDYALEAAPNLLMEGRNAAHPTELADLFGKRFVVCQESAQGQGLNESLVKRLTGGDPIRARRMREDFWTFDPTHKLWLSSNYRPVIRGTDEGIWRRIYLIPFNVFIPTVERDRDLPKKLAKERNGILTWALRGWSNHRRGGLQPPAAVQLATGDYRTEQDVIGRFLDECVEAARGERLPAADLHRRYEAWCRQNGEVPVNPNELGRRLTDRGFERKKSGVVFFLGVRLRHADN